MFFFSQHIARHEFCPRPRGSDSSRGPQPGKQRSQRYDRSIDLVLYLGAAVSGCSAQRQARPSRGEGRRRRQHGRRGGHISDDPSVNIQVNLDPANNTVGLAIATSTYQFGVNGPSGQPVNVYVIGAISITDVHASGPITAGSVYYTLVGPGVNGYNVDFINSSAGVQHILDEPTILSGDTYTVTLSTGVNLNEGIPTCCEAMPGQIATVTANFDPTVRSTRTPSMPAHLASSSVPGVAPVPPSRSPGRGR